MRSQELIAAIVTRTKLPHDEVTLVLKTLREITMLQLSHYQEVIIPRMMRIGVRALRSNKGWRVHISPFRDLQQAVGASVRPIDEEV
jgi:DNA-binding IclR family transcriptional regulator